MAGTSRRPRRLSDAQLQQLLALTKDADSVELKLTVPDSQRYSTITALGMDPLDAQIRQVYFFDTPDLAPQPARRRRPGPPGPGPRRRHGRQAPADRPGELPPSVRSSKHKETAAGRRAIRKPYSKQQQARSPSSS